MVPKLEARDWLTIIVFISGFAFQYVTVKNDVDWVKQTLIRHEALIMSVLAKKE
jgi:hypothetical protein